MFDQEFFLVFALANLRLELAIGIEELSILRFGCC